MASDIRSQAEDLVRYHSELERRLAQAGVRDIAEVLALDAQLRRALGVVSRQEIGWAAEQTDRLVADLDRVAAELAALLRLKTTLDTEPTRG